MTLDSFGVGGPLSLSACQYWCQSEREKWQKQQQKVLLRLMSTNGDSPLEDRLQ